MSEERLKEIKDSIGLQASVMQIKHLDTTIIDEELELYNEVIRLREENKQLDDLRNANYLSWQDSLSRIDKAIEYIENTEYYEPLWKIDKPQLILNDERTHNLLNILNGDK